MFIFNYSLAAPDLKSVFGSGAARLIFKRIFLIMNNQTFENILSMVCSKFSIVL